MYIKVAAVSNNIKVAYFSKIDFASNLQKLYPFAEQISSSAAEIIQNNKDLNKNKNNSNTQ